MKNILVFTAMLALCSCSKPETSMDDENLITFNNFESVDGWGNSHPSITKEKAYSGKYATKVDQANEYSFGYDKLIGQITTKKPKKLKLEAWAYIPNKQEGGAQLVFVMTRPANNQQIIWEGIKFEDTHEFKEWTKVNKEINLPDNIEISDRVQVYLWRAGASQPVYIDDLKLSVLEYH